MYNLTVESTMVRCENMDAVVGGENDKQTNFLHDANTLRRAAVLINHLSSRVSTCRESRFKMRVKGFQVKLLLRCT